MILDRHTILYLMNLLFELDAQGLDLNPYITNLTFVIQQDEYLTDHQKRMRVTALLIAAYTVRKNKIDSLY